MKTLYISDLDGTLLLPDATLGEETITCINELIGQGMFFTVATARTAASVSHILKPLDVNVPCVLMNGVCIYDLGSRHYISAERLGPDAGRLIDIIHRRRLSGFLFSVKDDELFCRYENTSSPNAESFIAERVRKYGKRFERVSDFADHAADAVYYSLSDREEKLRDVYLQLQEISSLRAEFYRDIYNPEYWYLEVCAAGASKSRAVTALRGMYGFDKVISFGDNLNDLGMFESSDVCCAVANAHADVRRRADAVIQSNAENGVARWLRRNFRH